MISESRSRRCNIFLSLKLRYSYLVLLLMALACGADSRARPAVQPLRPTNTPRPTFTPTTQPISQALQPATATNSIPTPVPLTATPTVSPTAPASDLPRPTDTPTTVALPTDTPLPPPPTATPLPTDTPLPTSTPAPVINFVLAGTRRAQNCDFTAIQGSVKNANNFGLAEVEVQALGIHETSGRSFSTRTDAEGHYEIFRIPLPDLQAGQWAVMVMEDGREVSERFHWASTPVCNSDDDGHSQILTVDWKLIE